MHFVCGMAMLRVETYQMRTPIMSRFKVEVVTYPGHREGGLREMVIDVEARDKWEALAVGKRRGHELNHGHVPRVRVFEFVKTDPETVT